MNFCSDLKVSIMTEKDQGKFARKAQRILHRDQPMSLAELMSEEEHEIGNPETRVSGFPENQESREYGKPIETAVRFGKNFAFPKTSRTLCGSMPISND